MACQYEYETKDQETIVFGNGVDGINGYEGTGGVTAPAHHQPVYMNEEVNDEKMDTQDNGQYAFQTLDSSDVDVQQRLFDRLPLSQSKRAELHRWLQQQARPIQVTPAGFPTAKRTKRQR